MKMKKNFDINNDFDEEPEETWQLPETQLRAISILTEIIRITPRNDPRLDYLLILEHSIGNKD
jgi:hypothetical protein